MKAVIQRVLSAHVSVDGEIISQIGRGLCVLIGLSRGDSLKDIAYIVRKILNTRFFEDEEERRWSKNVKDKHYEVLCVSQITLYHTFKGNKLDFHKAMHPERSQQFFSDFMDELRREYRPDHVKEGKFGAHMVVSIQNDGPVTIQLESCIAAEEVTDNFVEGIEKTGTVVT